MGTSPGCMYVVLHGVGLGTVLVMVAAKALSATSSVSGGLAWEPLQACGAAGHLQCSQLRVKPLHLGLDSWLVEKRLWTNRMWQKSRNVGVGCDTCAILLNRRCDSLQIFLCLLYYVMLLNV